MRGCLAINRWTSFGSLVGYSTCNDIWGIVTVILELACFGGALCLCPSNFKAALEGSSTPSTPFCHHTVAIIIVYILLHACISIGLPHTCSKLVTLKQLCNIKDH